MALFKNEEEKAADREAKAKAEADQQAAAAQQQAAAKKAAEDAAFAASPVGRATAARAAGSTFFQIEMDVSQLTGATSFFGSSDNTITHTSGASDVLGQIESVGWHLEHVGYVFVETGATSTDRMFLSGQGTVTQGSVVGIYLFRKAGA